MYLLPNDNTINKVYSIVLFTLKKNGVSIEQIQNIVMFLQQSKNIFKHVLLELPYTKIPLYKCIFTIVIPLFDIPCVLGYISIKIVVYKIKIKKKKLFLSILKT